MMNAWYGLFRSFQGPVRADRPSAGDRNRGAKGALPVDYAACRPIPALVSGQAGPMDAFRRSSREAGSPQLTVQTRRLGRIRPPSGETGDALTRIHLTPTGNTRYSY